MNSSGLGNVGTFTSNVGLPQTSNFGVVHIDHDFSSKWHFMSSYRYYHLIRATDSQVDIANGAPTSLSARPQVPWFYAAALTTNITTNTTNDIHYSFLRNFWQWGSAGDPPQLAGLAARWIRLASRKHKRSLLTTSTRRIPAAFLDGKDNMIRDDVSNLHGNHLFQFGGTYERNWDFHERSNKRGGINYQPVYELGIASNSGINVAPDIPSSVATGDAINFGRDYVALSASCPSHKPLTLAPAPN